MAPSEQTPEERLAVLETEVEFIKLQVSNHIPTQLRAIQASVDTLTHNYLRVDAVAKFVAIAFQTGVLVLGAVWTFKNLIGK